MMSHTFTVHIVPVTFHRCIVQPLEDLIVDAQSGIFDTLSN